MFADYHVHCEFSDDSREAMEAQVLRGIELGLQEICFTDHVDYGIKKDHGEADIVYQPIEDGQLVPLVNVDYPAYFSQLKKLQERYGDQITIRKGLEFGIQSITIADYQKLFAAYEEELDFVLLSVHQIDNKELWTQDFQKDKTQQEYNEDYYREIYKIQRSFSDYCVLAHLDLIRRYDEQGEYPFAKVKELIAEILKLAISQDKGIEINTSSWRYGLKDTQPSRAVLELYKDLGGRIITIGSDAHNTRQLADHYQDAQRILKQCGFSQICCFEKRQPIFYDI